MEGMLRAIPIVLILTTAAMITPTQAFGQSTPCTRSAGDIFRACRFDVRDDFETTLANCRQFDERGQRRACGRQARDDQTEGFATCRDQREARVDVCDLLGEVRYADPLLDNSIQFVDPDFIGDGEPVNPYVSLEAGHTFVLRAGEDLASGDFEELVVVHVTDEVREIQEVPCRVVVDVAIEVGEDEEDGGIDYIPVEVTDDWFAQDDSANVYYCGEIARNFEDGVLRDLDGSFESGTDFAKAGLLIAADPNAAAPAHRQEYALAEAEDILEYVDNAASPTAEEGGENPAFPCAGNCLKTLEFTPIEPEASEFKYYLPGTGFVLAVALEEGEPTGEREELVCVGDSLDVLSSADCSDAVEDPVELLDDLCEFHPEAFCEDDEDD